MIKFFDPRYENSAIIVNKLISIPPRRAVSTVPHSRLLPKASCAFPFNSNSILVSELFSEGFRLFLSNHPMTFLLLLFSGSDSFFGTGTVLSSDSPCVLQLSSPQPHGSGLPEHAQASSALEQGEQISLSPVACVPLEFVQSRIWITSPKTDHLPTDVIFTMTEEPSMLSGPTTSTWMYPLVWPTYGI